ncbi:MAG: hypothetical protein NVV59_19925 [Chitinophagaceae bacterium]|nr:hypothetical protein [Chitinophagaceae bacterium]
MKNTSRERFEKLVAPLYFYMMLSRRAYDKYLQNKILLHALNIFSANEKIVTLIESQPALIPEELIPDAIELVNHYGIWMNQFREFHQSQPFTLKDTYIFHHIDHLSAFPKDAERRFFEYYHQLKKELTND